MLANTTVISRSVYEAAEPLGGDRKEKRVECVIIVENLGGDGTKYKSGVLVTFIVIIIVVC